MKAVPKFSDSVNDPAVVAAQKAVAEKKPEKDSKFMENFKKL